MPDALDAPPQDSLKPPAFSSVDERFGGNAVPPFPLVWISNEQPPEHLASPELRGGNPSRGRDDVNTTRRPRLAQGLELSDMLTRILFAAGLALGLSGAAAAQQMSGGGQRMTLYDIYGNPVGVPGFPMTTAPGPSSATSGAIAPTSGGTQTAYVAKASGGNLYGFSATMGATAGFLALLNSATAPAAGAAITPLECIAVPANGYVARRQDIPDRYGTGIAAVITSSCTTYLAVTPVLTTLLVQ